MSACLRLSRQFKICSSMRHFAARPEYYKLKQISLCFESAPYLGSLCYSSSSSALQANENQSSGGFKKRNTGPRDDLDRSLFQLDLEVRRTGRISRNEVLSLINEIRSRGLVTSSQILMLIRCCGSFIPDELPDERIKLVKNLWSTLNDLGVSLDVSHYNALLRVYLENQYKFSPSDFLADLDSKQIEPNRVTYQRLISRYCEEGDIKGATKILEYMKQKDLPINEAIFNSLIVGHAKASDFDNAKNVLDMMRKAGLEPGPESYLVLMKCYAEVGNLSEVQKLLQELEEKHIDLADKDYLGLLHSLCIGGQLDYIEEILSKIKKQPGYNQECINAIYELCNLGYDDVAFRLLKTMSPTVNVDGNVLKNSGNFYLKHLVKLKRPVEDIFKYCDELKSSDQNLMGIYKVLESCYLLEREDCIEAIMRKILEGEELRIHYFWPWLALKGRQSDPQGVLDIVNTMKNLGTNCNFDTLKDYVAPYVDCDSDSLLKHFIDAGYSPGAIINPFACHLLFEGRFKEARKLVAKHKVQFVPNVIKQVILEGLNKNADYPSMSMFLKTLLTSSDNNESVDIPALVLVDFLRGQHKDEVIEAILKAYQQQKLPISSFKETIRDSLKKIMNTSMKGVLSDLETNEASSLNYSSYGPKSMSIAQLEEALTQARANNKPTFSILKHILQIHLKNRDLEKSLEIKKLLDAQDFVYPTGVSALFLSLYTYHGYLKEALDIFSSLKDTPDFHLDNSKMLNLLVLMVEKGQLNAAVELLKDYPTNADISKDVGSRVACGKLLRVLSDSGNEQTVNDVFQLLKEKNLVEVTSNSVRPLVQVYLDKGDSTKAVEVFKQFAEEHKITPCYSELLRHYIKVGDAEGLQSLVDIGTSVHGEMNSIYNLLFALLEENKLSEAEKLLQTPGLRAKNPRLAYKCQQYLSRGETETLERLVAMTRNLFDIDRNMMYLYLLKAYCQEENVDKALGVWVSLQEEDVLPSAELLTFLGNYLRERGREVPFLLPLQDNKPVSPVTIKSLLIDSKLDEALQLKRRLQSENKTISIRDFSSLIDELVTNERLNEASKLTMELFSKNVHPLPRTLRFLVSRLAQQSDYKSLETLCHKMTPEIRKQASIDNKICNAYVGAGLGISFLEKLIVIADEDHDKFTTTFPSGGLLGLLEKEDGALLQFEQLAEKEASRGFLTPMNVIWMHKLIKQNYSEAQAVFEKYLLNTEFLMFKSVMRRAKEHKNLDMAQNCLKQLESCQSVNKSSLGLAHSALIDILIDEQKYSDANDQIEVALKHSIPLHNLCLSKAKSAIEAAGGEFKHHIPSKRAKYESDSSSSSSDSE